MGKTQPYGLNPDQFRTVADPSNPSTIGRSGVEAAGSTMGNRTPITDAVGFKNGQGTKAQPIPGEAVTVTATPKEITGRRDVLSHVNVSPMPPYNGPYGYGNARKGYRSATQANAERRTPVYDESLTVADSDDNIPIGNSTQTPQQKMSNPGVAEGVAQHGSIEDMTEFEKASGGTLSVTPDVRSAMDQKKNLAPATPTRP